MTADPRLPDLFARASELEGEARAAWLAALRAEDAAIAGELAELLAASTAGERRFATPAWERLSPAEAPRDASARDEAPIPERIGPYRIRREIGRGGMGRVFLAEQEEAEFRRTVALKILDRPAAAAEALRRFRDEARILAALEHPGIARLYDAGRTADGTWFLALEYVEGEDLLSFVRRHGLGVRARVELFLQVLDAVDFAHRRLVVHRDVKPGNVVVGKDGRPKLLDFGISKVLDAEADEEAATRTELRALTPAYASPEQLRGERATIASDVYSLGVVLYEILAGRRPFARADGSGVDRARATAERDADPPSTAVRRALPAPAERAAAAMPDVTAVRWRDLAGDLDAIALKALRGEPESRYRSAADFADDLRRWLDGRPVEARRGGRRYRAAKFVRRHRAPVASAALAVLALLGGTVIAVVQARASARERDRALEDLRRAEITQDWSAFLLSAPAPASGQPGWRNDLLARGEQLIERRYAADPGLRVYLLLTLADRYEENWQNEAWKRTAERAYVLSRPLHEASLRALASCLAANVAAEAGDGERARALISEGLAELAHEDAALAEEARCRLAESRVAFMAGDSAAAIPAAERSLTLERARHGSPGRELEALNVLAMVYGAGGRHADADRTFAELMRLFAQQGRDRTQGAAMCANNWANAAYSAGQMLRAAELFERAAALAREVDPDRGPLAGTLAALANSLSLTGRSTRALAVADEAVGKARAPEQHWLLVYALFNGARVALDAGRRDVAEQRLAELEAIARAEPPVKPKRRVLLEHVQARVALARGDAASAVKLARSAIASAEAAGMTPGDTVQLLVLLAWSLNEHGDYGEARQVAERAGAMAKAELGGFPHSHELGATHLELGRALARLGEVGAARETLGAALAHLRASDGEAGPYTRRAVTALAQIGRPGA